MRVEGLSGRTTIITAAGQNAGKAVSLAFAKAGANVVVVGLSEMAKIESVADAAESLGVRALPLLADCADWKSVEKMVETALQAFGSVVSVNV